MTAWQELNTEQQWEELKETGQPFVVFKHSTTCPVSSNALEEFESYLQDNPRQDVVYSLVKVIESRPVSNKIAEELTVKHESPQILFVDKGKCIWNTSHWSVTKAHITAVLD